MTEERIDLKSPDGVLDVHAFIPDAGSGVWPAVVLYMDAFGIRPQLAGMARRLASNGYIVAVPNLYYRTPFAPFEPTVVTTEGPERERFKGMIASINHGMVMRDTALVIAWLDGHPAVHKGSLGALGYCMGGGYALSAAGTFPDRVAVAASFHGGSLATDKPDSPHRLAGRIRARVYIGAAEIDPSFPPEQQNRLEQALTETGVRHTIEIYPKARHGFAVTGHVVYDHESSERHWQRLLEVLKDTLAV
jgi:carboxymethylenebutenolidase